MTTVLDKQQAYTLVVGLGVTGLSVVKYLHGLGETVVVVDSRVRPPCLEQLQQSFPDVAVYCGTFDTEMFKGAHRIVLSPGVALATPAVYEAGQSGVEITGDIDLFSHEVNAPVIGITGSNGKSTVTALLNAMALRAGIQVAMGGNIGTPALELLDDENQLYVLELSSFQLETMHELRLSAGVVLNISDDHMDRYRDFASYVQSKHVIYQHSRNWVVNRDDAVASSVPFAAEHVTGFTLSEPAPGDFGLRSVDGEEWLYFGEKPLLRSAEIKIKGRHNIMNALATLALGQYAGIEVDTMLETLREFPGLPHRTQWVAERDGVNWYNDSKATNVGATLAAIEGMPGKQVLIAGGEGKGADFSLLRSVSSRLRAVVLIGRDADIIAAALGDEILRVRAQDMKQAVQFSAKLAQPGDNVLLSPACASFDMFDNFGHRGEVFMQDVRELLA